MNAATKRKVNKALSNLSTYHDWIPFASIREVIQNIGGSEILDEAGEPWEGIFCGRDGNCVFPLKDSKYGLALAWHKMEVTGRYEIVCYVN